MELNHEIAFAPCFTTPPSSGHADQHLCKRDRAHLLSIVVQQ